MIKLNGKVIEKVVCELKKNIVSQKNLKYVGTTPEYQRQVDENELEFADNAVGSSSWRSDW